MRRSLLSRALQPVHFSGSLRRPKDSSIGESAARGRRHRQNLTHSSNTLRGQGRAIEQTYFSKHRVRGLLPNVTGQARSSPLKSKSKRGELPLTLKIRMNIMVDDHVFPVRALVDAGAEVNIIRRGIIPENFLQKDSHPLTLRGRMKPNSRVATYV